MSVTDEPTLGQVDEEAAAPSKGKEDPAEQAVPQKQLDDLEERLMKKLALANAGCKCAIA